MTRGKFSLTREAQIEVLQEAKQKEIPLLVISTCNRTELIGYVPSEEVLVDLLCSNAEGTKHDFRKYAFTHKGDDAINHVLKLGTGLESQILGDFEIIGQLKGAFALAKEFGYTNANIERLVNTAIQTSKAVKNNTAFSTNAASTAYAAVQWIKDFLNDSQDVKITLFGTGEIGKVTCANLVKHFPNNSITLVNRTQEKADSLGEKFNVNVAPFSDLEKEVQTSNVLIVATNAPKVTVTADLINAAGNLAIVDLSVPTNVEITSENRACVVTLDELTKVVDKTLEKREQEIPKVKEIIAENFIAFKEWLSHRTHTDAVKAFKDRLLKIKQEEINFQSKKIAGLNEEHMEIVSERIIQKMTKQFITHLKTANGNAGNSIKVMTEIFDLDIKQS
ncbi:Glutamyl-tRNA reductase [Parvicella tangerina]|uniref:Glutamyl-tRNA reductase n=2 Tax=Parvicella tangerina TaxID=2829795 RepID=A0A916JNN6_9FLAO|nr:Glutamyl-tRNA reductase [Parvicella tangerina]